MTKKEFHKKWGIGVASVYYYQKRFPEIVTKEKPIDYAKLDAIIQGRIDVKEKVKQIMLERKAKEIEFLFERNAGPKAHIFIYQLYAQNEQILVRDSGYKKYLKIIEKFGTENVKTN